MKDLVVHIGVQKTGSTAMQKHFSLYSLLHRGLGLHYPRLGDEPYRNQDIADDIKFTPGSFVTQAQYLKVVAKSRSSKFLMSAEKLFRLQRAPEYFKPFSEIARVRIVIFIRRQDRFLESLYRQLVKNSTTSLDSSFGKFNSFAELRIEQDEHRQNIEWLTCIEPWEQMFGKENITIVPYDEYKRIDSIAVMADLFEMPIIKRLPLLGFKHGNPSLCAETAHFLRYLRLDGIPFNVSKIRRFDSLIPNPSDSFLALKDRQDIVESFRENNEALGRHYGIDVSPLLAFDPVIESQRKVFLPDEVNISSLMELAEKAGLLKKS